MCSKGDCLIVLTPHCANGTIIFGRNAIDAEALGVAQELCYYDKSNALEGECDGGVSATIAGDNCRLILQKPSPGIWGGDFGANERNISIGIVWATPEAEIESGYLRATDILRYALARATTANNAVEQMGALVVAHAADNARFNFVICDPTELWLLSCIGKLWAAQRHTTGYFNFAGKETTMPNSVDASSDNLEDALKTLGHWNGEGKLNLAACFGSPDNAVTTTNWYGEAPVVEGTFTVTNMFETLRLASNIESARSASVSVLTAAGISCHWFTVTPNASDSVFKPFVFALNPKISPLTQVSDDSKLTLLHKLHAKRKPTAIDDLKALEEACVQEVDKYLAEHPKPDEELDELLKDCVEAEVKFYR